MYDVNVKLENRTEIVPFYSFWNAVRMSAKYGNCVDVFEVNIIDAQTGEILVTLDKFGSPSYVADEAIRMLNS